MSAALGSSRLPHRRPASAAFVQLVLPISLSPRRVITSPWASSCLLAHDQTLLAAFDHIPKASYEACINKAYIKLRSYRSCARLLYLYLPRSIPRP